MNELGVILLVEDDKRILHTNKRMLESEGFQVYCAETLAEARATMAVHAPDVVVLDIRLPDGSGLDFCAEIHNTVTVPVLFLTALDAQEDIIQGFEAGGNDYIAKPYDMDEFLARIKAQYNLVRMLRSEVSKNRNLVRGLLTLDVMVARAYLNGMDLLLAPKEFALLLFLMQHEGESFSNEHLFRHIWQQPINNSSHALKNAAYRLRKKLEGSGYTVVATRGEGYRFERA